MKFLSTTILSLLLATVTVTLSAQTADFYPLDQVEPGQKGYAKTVFEGTTIERFGVEILGVLQNIGPKQNVVLARLSGEKLERTGVFAGMSGSPVYIDDKLLGAVAFTFPFLKEPIVGITPIREMVDIFKENPSARFQIGKRINAAKMYAVADLPEILSHFEVPDFFRGARTVVGKLQPIATPLNLSGFSSKAIEEFAPHLARLGLFPVGGTGTARIDHFKDVPLQPGSSINVQLVRGDLDLSASGTVTDVSGEKIYAFGHPFLGIGSTDLPLNKAAVLAVIPSLQTSMKISAPVGFAGSVTQDRATGLMGIAGQEPALIPVEVKLHTSRNDTKRFNYEVVTDKFLTPFLITFTVYNSIISSERSIGGQTLQVKSTIAVKDQEDVKFENSVTDMMSSSAFAALAAASPVNFLLNSGFEDLVMEKIGVEITAVEQTREATLDKVWHDKVEVKPGEELTLTVFLRKSNGETTVEKYPIKIPEDIGTGPLNVVVADGVALALAEAESDLGSFVPQDLQQLIEAINNLKKNDRLYIRLTRKRSGAIVEGEGMPGLPPSLLTLYDSQKASGGIKPIDKVVYVEHELPPTDLVLSGRQEITVHVK